MGANEPVACGHCGGPMVATTKTESSAALQVAGVLVFLMGLSLLVFFPIGTVVGIVLIVGACKMGYNKRKVRQCTQCGYFYDIA